jgi:hypothetical protein
MKKNTVPKRDRHVGDLQSQQRVNITPKDKRDIPIDDGELSIEDKQLLSTLYWYYRYTGHTRVSATRIAEGMMEKKFLEDLNRGYYRPEEPDDKILLEKDIIDMLEANTGVLTFQDLSDIKGFPGNKSLDVVYTPDPSRHKKVSVWTECSQLAVECMIKLSMDQVLSLVPIEDLGTALCLYSDAILQGLPIMLPEPFKKSNQHCWLPCMVCKGRNFDGCDVETYNRFEVWRLDCRIYPLT